MFPWFLFSNQINIPSYLGEKNFNLNSSFSSYDYEAERRREEEREKEEKNKADKNLVNSKKIA